MVPLKEHFKTELEEIKVIFQNEIRFKTARFEELIDIKFNELDLNACALIVLTVNKTFGGTTRSAVGLASIVQYIFMADQVHRLMKDDPKLSESERQFPVLVGDFLYGKFFLGLCKEKLLHYLSPLAQVIGVMNQGAISRWLSEDKTISEADQLHILEMERAALTGLAARLGAHLAGCSENVQQRCEDLGWQLGLAWAASQNRMETSVIGKALDKAREILTGWPELKTPHLNELVDYLEGQLGEVS